MVHDKWHRRPALSPARRIVRGDTSDRVAGGPLSEPAVGDLVARAERAQTLVEVQRLVTELRTKPGLRDVALRAMPGGAADDGTELNFPVGPAGLNLSLRAQPPDERTATLLRPALAELAAAAERTLP